MILQALDGYYHRVARQEGSLPAYGYSDQPISYALVVAKNGSVQDVMPLVAQRGRRTEATRMPVPRPVIRTSGVAANFLWDKTAYVLGVKRDPNDKAKWVEAPREHAAFRKLHEELLATSDDEGLGAVLAVLARWTPSDVASVLRDPDILDANVVFRLDGDRGFVHDRPAAREIWAGHLASLSGADGLCLVTGATAPLARLHPSLKGVRGAQSSGASIVSFNLDAFTSFGKDQGLNAPVSEQAAFAYTTALNHLLRPGDHNRQRLQVGDATTVFWAEAASAAGEAAAEAAEDLFGSLLAPPAEDALGEKATGRLRAILEKVAAGRPLQEIDPALDPGTRCFVLGLAPNASRLSVRFWQVDDLGTLVARLGEHWHDLAIEPRPWKMAPEPWRLVRETAPQGKAENVPPTLAGETMRSILTGGHYPETLFASVVMRCRTDRELNGIRAAILKACLVRADRKAGRKESVSVSLDTQETNAGYRLGRLFAVLESIQRTALGPVNASIRDRYYGAASATPGAVFPVLLRTAGHHLANVRKGDKTKLAGWFEREIGEIMDGIGTSLPRNLAIADQGRFAIGYYHQRYGRHKVAPPEVATDLQDAPSEDEV
jgi:CRISPR-associated protein Csd1